MLTFTFHQELYAKNKSFLKHFRETAAVDVTQGILNDFRNFLNDQEYSVSKIYGFKMIFTIFNK